MLAWVIDSPAQLNGTVVSLGRPVEGMAVSIWDENGGEVDAGEVGEIVAQSRYLACGYWNNPALTAEKFEGDSDATRLYHTGDLGLLGDDAVFVYQGRADNQLSVRGFRVELGEVEAKILAHPRVKDAVALASAERIDAFVTVEGGGELSFAAFRDFLRDRLPSHMIPGKLVVLEAFPRTPNGKVDRHTLGKGIRAVTVARDLVAYEDEVDLRLAGLWGEILGVDGVGLDDDFLDLGGTSLKAIVMIARVEREFGRRIPLTALVTGLTLRDFAKLIRSEDMFEEEACLVPIHPSGEKPPIFWLHGLGGGGGGLLRYGTLARLLGEDQPSYGVQAPRVPYTSLEAMAEAYIKLMRKQWPSGPYRLGGYCFGSKLAYETARQLTEAGDTVDFLELLAPAQLFDARWTLGDRLRLGAAAAADWRSNLDRIIGASMGDRVQFVRRRVRGATRSAACGFSGNAGG